MTIVPGVWAVVDEVSKRIDTFRSKYEANPLIHRIEHTIGSDWSDEPSVFLKVVLAPGPHDIEKLKKLSSDLNQDRLRIIHAEDRGLHCYLNFSES